MSKKRVFAIVVLVLFSFLVFAAGSSASAADAQTIPVKGMVTMVDLGAATCIPCKMMAPILEKLEKRYRGKAAIVFVDLRYNRDASRHFNVQAIPTQIFFDKNGREITRHIGFMSEEAILAQLKSMGIQ